MQESAGLKSRVIALWLAVRTWLHFCWISLNNYLWRDKMWRRRDGLHREILIVGDETAVGFGDWIVCSQTPGYGKTLRRELMGGGGRGPTEIRFTWNVFSVGHLHSTSDDWLPDQTKKPSRLPFLVWKNLFEDTFGPSGRFADCDCVVLHVGLHDRHKDPEQTAANCMRIAEELIQRGKRVWISGMPVRGHMDRIRHGWLLSERNQAIRQAVTKLGHPYLNFGIDLEEYRRQDLYTWDSTHLSSRGYSKLGRDMYKLLRWPLVSIEFRLLHPTMEHSDDLPAEEGGETRSPAVGDDADEQRARRA
eukprot:TRINITY_DN39744_c0_g1_i1.p2 TRINITY_DN39744_c0_g1~~TRINITY_DN39744_c0_g1_i1.p2  ORF type:complete len:305 (+),score=97.05 TRINITY_DN39744_c0_g1_i1:99-1013(+)